MSIGLEVSCSIQINASDLISSSNFVSPVGIFMIPTYVVSMLLGQILSGSSDNYLVLLELGMCRSQGYSLEPVLTQIQMYQVLGVVTQQKALRLTSESTLTGIQSVQFGTSIYG